MNEKMEMVERIGGCGKEVESEGMRVAIIKLHYIHIRKHHS